eukprot:IDg15030t1
MEEWNDSSPRAFAPTEAMLTADVPIAATSELAHSSALPYGLGVYTVEEGDNTMVQPLFWVSERVAESRGRGVTKGWYAVIKPGSKFKLALTKVQKSKQGSINGVTIGEDCEAGAEIYVDGISVFRDGGYAWQRTPCENLWVIGFDVKSRDSENEVCVDVLPFCFKRAAVGSVLSKEKENCGNSLIRLKVFQGFLSCDETASPSWSCEIPSSENVSEEVAIKHGRSLQAARSGETVPIKVDRCTYVIERDGSYDGIIDIHVRERFWLESRRIIDSDGNAWSPVKQTCVIDLVSDKSELSRKHDLSDVPENRKDHKKVKSDVDNKPIEINLNIDKTE